MDLYTQCVDYVKYCNISGIGNEDIYELCFFYVGNFNISKKEIETLKEYFLR